MQFGCFVQLEGVRGRHEGLVHISEMSAHHVDLPEQVVTPGEELWVKIIDIDLQRRRISLSIKQTTEAPEREQKKPKEEQLEEAKAALPKHRGPLKGGVDKPSGGEKFGLKW